MTFRPDRLNMQDPAASAGGSARRAAPFTLPSSITDRAIASITPGSRSARPAAFLTHNTPQPPDRDQRWRLGHAA